MTFETVWTDVRERLTALDGDVVLVTPRSNRPFTVERVSDDHVDVDFRDHDEERALWRTQFEVLYERLVDGEELDLPELPTGVEPYVSALSVLPQFGVENGNFRLVAENGETHDGADHDAPPDGAVYGVDSPAVESPFVRPEWSTRTTPERVHDDALLLADALERYDVAARAVDSMDEDALVDLYVLLSDVSHRSDELRRSIGDGLLDRIGPDGRLHGRFGSVVRAERERRRLKPTEVVFDALDAAGVPTEWVVGVDRDKLDVVLSVTDLEPASVYEFDEQVYVQKTDVEEPEKQSHLRGLKERLAGLDDEETEDLHEEIAGLEERIDEVLASG